MGFGFLFFNVVWVACVRLLSILNWVLVEVFFEEDKVLL